MGNQIITPPTYNAHHSLSPCWTVFWGAKLEVLNQWKKSIILEVLLNWSNILMACWVVWDGSTMHVVGQIMHRMGQLYAEYCDCMIEKSCHNMRLPLLEWVRYVSWSTTWGNHVLSALEQMLDWKVMTLSTSATVEAGLPLVVSRIMSWNSSNSEVQWAMNTFVCKTYTHHTLKIVMLDVAY